MTLREKIGPLAAALPEARLHPAAVAAADASAEKGEHWLIGFSGGADSLALLLLLWAHWPEQRERLVPAHFNHRLRGAESDADERFAREICAELGLPFRSGAWADAPEKSSEDAARQARYSFFDYTAGEVGANTLALGHQLDDVAETQLMRLARGASSAGLAAPRPVREWGKGRKILRPLLTVSGSELREALRQAGIAWRTDSSNEGSAYLRNRIRRDVVPAWLRAAGPGALAGAALSREWLEEDDAALETWLNQLGVPVEPEQLDLRPLAGMPRGLWRRAVRRWKPAAELSRRAFDELLTLCIAGVGRMSVAEGFAVIENGWLLLKKTDSEQANESWQPAWWSGYGTLSLPDGGELRAEVGPVTPGLRERVYRGKIDPEREAIVEVSEPGWTVRTWREGDRFRPLGAPGTAKLQDLFVNRKIPVSVRRTLPILERPDGRIVWVPGLPPAEDSKITDHSVTAAQLTYTPGTTTVRD